MQLLTLTTFKEIRSPHRSNASWRHLFFLSFGQKYIVEKGLYSLSHTGIHHPLKFLKQTWRRRRWNWSFPQMPLLLWAITGGEGRLHQGLYAPHRVCEPPRQGWRTNFQAKLYLCILRRKKNLLPHMLFYYSWHRHTLKHLYRQFIFKHWTWENWNVDKAADCNREYRKYDIYIISRISQFT